MAATRDSVKSKDSLCKNDFPHVAGREASLYGPGGQFSLLESASRKKGLPVETGIHFPVSQVTGLKRRPSKELNSCEYAKTAAQLFWHGSVLIEVAGPTLVAE